MTHLQWVECQPVCSTTISSLSNRAWTPSTQPKLSYQPRWSASLAHPITKRGTDVIKCTVRAWPGQRRFNISSKRLWQTLRAIRSLKQLRWPLLVNHLVANNRSLWSPWDSRSKRAQVRRVARHMKLYPSLSKYATQLRAQPSRCRRFVRFSDTPRRSMRSTCEASNSRWISTALGSFMIG